MFSKRFIWVRNQTYTIKDQLQVLTINVSSSVVTLHQGMELLKRSLLLNLKMFILENVSNEASY